MPAIDPTPEPVAMLTGLREQGPVSMINLLEFKKPGGAERYEVYGRAVLPLVDRAGGRMVWGGEPRAIVVGDDERPWWDAIVVVEYPSVAAFIAMVTSPEYAAIAHHRTEALDRAELIATGYIGSLG